MGFGSKKSSTEIVPHTRTKSGMGCFPLVLIVLAGLLGLWTLGNGVGSGLGDMTIRTFSDDIMTDLSSCTTDCIGVTAGRGSGDISVTKTAPPERSSAATIGWLLVIAGSCLVGAYLFMNSGLDG